MYIIKFPMCQIPGSELECFVRNVNEDTMTISFTADEAEAMRFYAIDAADVLGNWEDGAYQIEEDSDFMPCDDCGETIPVIG